MIEVLEFIFQGFWHFIGTILLLGTIANIVNSIFSKPTTINNFNSAKEE